jgi:hypothetical protein
VPQQITTVEATTVKVPGATLYVEVRGSGPVLLCITGVPTDAGMFAVSPDDWQTGTRSSAARSPASRRGRSETSDVCGRGRSQPLLHG